MINETTYIILNYLKKNYTTFFLFSLPFIWGIQKPKLIESRNIMCFC